MDHKAFAGFLTTRLEPVALDLRPYLCPAMQIHQESYVLNLVLFGLSSRVVGGCRQTVELFGRDRGHHHDGPCIAPVYTVQIYIMYHI